MSSTEHNSRRFLVERMRELLSPLAPNPTGVSPVLPSLPGIRIVLFDVYGTLLVSVSGDIGTRENQADGEAAQLALRGAGMEVVHPKAGIHAESGLRQSILQEHEALRRKGVDYPEVDIAKIWTVVLKKLVDQDMVRGEIDDDRIALLAVEYECRTNPVWPMPGLADMLTTILGKKIEMGVISNSQFYTPLLFDVFLGEPIEALGFDAHLCSWSYRSGCAKPSARLFQPVAEIISREKNLLPDQVLYVGNDMLNDIQPARERGWRTALFAGDQRSLRMRSDRPELAGAKPDVVITELGQLTGLLAG